MRTLLFTLLLAIAATVGSLSSTGAGPCNSPTEVHVVRQLQARLPADLTSRDSAERTVGSACLRVMMTAPRALRLNPGQPIVLIGATVPDSFNMEREKINAPVMVTNTTFRGDVILSQTRFASDVAFDNSTFLQALDISRADFAGDLAMRGAVFHHGVNAFEAKVGNSLEAHGAGFLGRIDFRRISVSGDTRLSGITATHDADFSRAHFRGDLILERGRFAGGMLSFERAKVEQSLFLNWLADTLASTVSFLYADVEFSVRADSNVWGNTVNMRGLKAGQHVVVSNGVFLDRLNLSDARIGGDLKVDSARVLGQGRADFHDAAVTGVATFKASEFRHGARLDGMTVQSRLDLESAAFDRFLSLRDVSAQSVIIHGIRTPAVRDSFHIDGLSYARFLGQGGGGTDRGTLLGFLRRARYSADAYENLEQFYVNRGDKRSANHVQFSRRKWEFAELPIGSKIGSVLLAATMAYGRWPVLALFWCALFVLLGYGVFRRTQPTLVDENKACARTFHPLWYSIDTFLPAVDLKYADHWRLMKSEHPGAWVYLRIHTLAGWILIPIVLAAISGLLR